MLKKNEKRVLLLCIYTYVCGGVWLSNGYTYIKKKKVQDHRDSLLLVQIGTNDRRKAVKAPRGLYKIQYTLYYIRIYQW